MYATQFIITVDTEADNQWVRPRETTTRNAEFLPRFQEICERYRLKPTYLATYEMARSPAFQDFGRALVRRSTAEIGMHLHAWSSPPLTPLTSDDTAFQPYLVEYPEVLMRQKIRVLTALLEETFQAKMVSHRAGRWAFNATYARLLVEHGYLIDCSVTPHVSWRSHLGDPNGTGGGNYVGFPATPYFVDLTNISRPGPSRLLEVPVSVIPTSRPSLGRLRPVVERVPLGRRAVNRFFPRVLWLRPDRRNLSQMLDIVQTAVSQNWPHLEFVIHSSELMPGGSPLFRTRGEIDRLYHALETLFDVVTRTCSAVTLREFYEQFSARTATV